MKKKRESFNKQSGREKEQKIQITEKINVAVDDFSEVFFFIFKT